MLASFGGADLPVLRLPQVPALRYRRRFVVRVAPNVESSGTDWWISELPRITHHPVRLGWISRLPRTFSLRLRRL